LAAGFGADVFAEVSSVEDGPSPGACAVTPLIAVGGPCSQGVMNYARFVFAGFLSLAACGGLDENEMASKLDADGHKALCEEIVAAQGAPKDCGSGITVTPKTQAQCEAAASVDCTVKQIRACNDSIGGDICKLFTTAECMALGPCMK